MTFISYIIKQNSRSKEYYIQSEFEMFACRLGADFCYFTTHQSRHGWADKISFNLDPSRWSAQSGNAQSRLRVTELDSARGLSITIPRLFGLAGCGVTQLLMLLAILRALANQEPVSGMKSL